VTGPAVSLTDAEGTEQGFDAFPDNGRVVPRRIGGTNAWKYVDLVSGDDGERTFRPLPRAAEQDLKGRLCPHLPLELVKYVPASVTVPDLP